MKIRRMRRAYLRGRARGRAEAFLFLRRQADLQRGQVGDRRRRGALNHAADRLRDGREPGRPEDMLGVPRG